MIGVLFMLLFWALILGLLAAAVVWIVRGLRR